MDCWNFFFCRLKRNVASSPGSIMSYRTDIEPKLPVSSLKTHLATTQFMRSLYNVKFKRHRASAVRFEDSEYQGVAMIDFSYIRDRGWFSQEGLDCISGGYQVVAHRKDIGNLDRIDISSDRRGMKTLHVDLNKMSIKLTVKGVETPIPYAIKAKDEIGLFQDLLLISDLLVCKSGVSKNCLIVVTPPNAQKESQCIRCHNVLKSRTKLERRKIAAQAVEQYKNSQQECGQAAVHKRRKRKLT